MNLTDANKDVGLDVNAKETKSYLFLARRKETIIA
jgi:hypothetical protein